MENINLVNDWFLPPQTTYREWLGLLYSAAGNKVAGVSYSKERPLCWHSNMPSYHFLIDTTTIAGFAVPLSLTLVIVYHLLLTPIASRPWGETSPRALTAILWNFVLTGRATLHRFSVVLRFGNGFLVRILFFCLVRLRHLQTGDPDIMSIELGVLNFLLPVSEKFWIIVYQPQSSPWSMARAIAFVFERMISLGQTSTTWLELWEYSAMDSSKFSLSLQDSSFGRMWCGRSNDWREVSVILYIHSRQFAPAQGLNRTVVQSSSQKFAVTCQVNATWRISRTKLWLCPRTHAIIEPASECSIWTVPNVHCPKAKRLISHRYGQPTYDTSPEPH